MTISSSLASRLSPGGPARWSPYARPPDPGHVAGRSSIPPDTSRPPLRVGLATARLLGPARKEAAAPSGSRCRAEATAASDAACPNPPRRGCEISKPKQKRNPKNPNPAEREEEEPPVQESRAGGNGGFAFLCTLAGHTEAISGISLSVGVRVWDCNSGKGLRTLFGMHRVGKTPVLFCSLHNSNCIRLFDLPSFDEIGKLFSKKEVRTIELAAGGLLFTGDCAGELKVWRWVSEEEPQPRRS